MVAANEAMKCLGGVCVGGGSGEERMNVPRQVAVLHIGSINVVVESKFNLCKLLLGPNRSTGFLIAKDLY